jgi:dihydropyrimidinase
LDVKKEIDLVVCDGMVTSATEVRRSDVGIHDGRIVALGSVEEYEARAMVDAAGCYVLPGAIDVHTHPVYADDLADLGRAALHAGTTSVIAYVGALPAWGFEATDPIEVVRDYLAHWDGQAMCDFALHVAMGAGVDYGAVVPELVEMGIPSFKFFLTYRQRGMMVDDRDLLAAFKAIAGNGALAVVHAENGDGICFLEDELQAAGEFSNASYLESRPALLEAEAVLRVIALGEATDCPVYIPHISSSDAWRVVEVGRQRSKTPVWAETCPHYLLLNNNSVLERGARFKIAPPLRCEEDESALWDALGGGGIDVVASDHSGRTRAMKDEAKNIFEAPFGVEGAEHLLPLLYSEGVATGRMSVSALVAVLAENPADIFGLSPRKGRLTVGADADLVVLDPDGESTCTATDHLGNSDYCVYEGMNLHGAIRQVVRRGEVVVDGGVLIGGGGGQFLARSSGAYQRA